VPVLPNSLTFLAIGDWGRQGQFGQSDVADAMGPYIEATGSQFVSRARQQLTLLSHALR
jgi:hypothetical protein